MAQTKIKIGDCFKQGLKAYQVTAQSDKGYHITAQIDFMSGVMTNMVVSDESLAQMKRIDNSVFGDIRLIFTKFHEDLNRIYSRI